MKRRGIAILTLLATAAFGTGHAGDLGYPGGPPAHDLKSVWPTRSIASDPTGPIQLGRRPITLENTRLKVLADEIHSPIRSAGDASASLYWSCAELADGSRIWLASDEMGGGRIDEVAVGRSSGRDPTCPRLPATMTPIRLPHDLALGMSEAALIGALGSPNARKGEVLGFVHWRQVGPKKDWTYSATVTARIRSGVVTELSFGRITSN